MGYPHGKAQARCGQPADIGELVVLNKDADSVWRIVADTGERLATVEADFNPHEVAIFPDGALSYVTSLESEAHPGRYLVRWVTFYPGGGYAYVANNKTNDISVIDTDAFGEISRFDAEIHLDDI